MRQSSCVLLHRWRSVRVTFTEPFLNYLHCSPSVNGDCIFRIDSPLSSILILPMNQSIQDGIRMCGVSEHFVPVFHRQLAHYDNWVSLVHQIHYFQQVTALFWWESERGSSPLSSRSSRSLLYSLVRRLLYLPSALSGDNSKPCIPVGRHYVNATIFDRSLALTKYEFGFIFLAFSWCFRQRIPSYTPTI